MKSLYLPPRLEISSTVYRCMIYSFVTGRPSKLDRMDTQNGSGLVQHGQHRSGRGKATFNQNRGTL